MTEGNSRRGKGFAAMDKARLREISAKGGGSVKRESRSFFTNRELAATAGAKGGAAGHGGGRPPKVPS